MYQYMEVVKLTNKADLKTWWFFFFLLLNRFRLDEQIKSLQDDEDDVNMYVKVSRVFISVTEIKTISVIL